MTRKLVLLLNAMMLATPGLAQPSLPPAADAAIDAYLERTLTETDIPGFVALVTSADGTLYRGAFGLEDVARNKPMREDA
ncbi:MAG TPA: hypothetical protein VLD39_02790, partial [Gammaproteobacteria bacterium]|nr:hypothetical protein [Gammaproteobacteria bacterium]